MPTHGLMFQLSPTHLLCLSSGQIFHSNCCFFACSVFSVSCATLLSGQMPSMNFTRMPIFSSSVPCFVCQKWHLTFVKGRCVWSSGQTLVGSLIFTLYLWETTLKDERPHYLHWISGAAQGLAATATLPQRCHRCVLFCSMSYLLIYSPPPLHPRLTSYLTH